MHALRMSTTPRPFHRSATVTVQSRESRTLILVRVSATRGYPEIIHEVELDLEQVYERTLTADQCLSVMIRALEYAQHRRGRVVTRPTPISSTPRSSGAAGVPSGDHRGGVARSRRLSLVRGTDKNG